MVFLEFLNQDFFMGKKSYREWLQKPVNKSAGCFLCHWRRVDRNPLAIERLKFNISLE